MKNVTGGQIDSGFSRYNLEFNGVGGSFVVFFLPASRSFPLTSYYKSLPMEILLLGIHSFMSKANMCFCRLSEARNTEKSDRNDGSRRTGGGGRQTARFLCINFITVWMTGITNPVGPQKMDSILSCFIDCTRELCNLSFTCHW